jgi:two-component system sensor histidine kinase TctE
MEAGAVLEVEDGGPGIAPAERERVFAPFYRAASALQINPGGAGLGLAIVADIAALHGATLALLDKPAGSGLLVRVAFPAS